MPRGHSTRKPREVLESISWKDFRRAIKGSAGNKSLIASRASITRTKVEHLLAKPGWQWDVCRLRYQEAKEKIDDEAERTIREVMRQRKDVPSALRAAQFHLEKHKRKQYGPHSTVTVEGGEVPLTTRVDVTHDLLTKLPLEAKRALLEALEAAAPAPVDSAPPLHAKAKSKGKGV